MWSMPSFVPVLVPVDWDEKAKSPQPPALQMVAAMGNSTSGEAGIRTLGTLTGTPVFKTGAIGHSATSPAALRCWGDSVGSCGKVNCWGKLRQCVKAEMDGLAN